MDLSIIIPAFEEEIKIERDICAASDLLVENNLKGEIIIVDDGSQDKTAAIAEMAGQREISSVRVIRNEQHRGKGFAVKTGILASKGQFVMFTDSGLSTPLECALEGMNLIKSGECDIANGSRKLKESLIIRPQPLLRRIISKLLRLFLIVWIKLPAYLTDTQCGFKVYRGQIAKKLYGGSILEGYLFDIEIIMRASKAGFKIKEFPIEWSADPDSRLLSYKNLISILKEVIALKKLF